MYQPLDKGGLGLTDLRIKSDALFVKGMRCLWDGDGPPWRFLGLYWSALSLSRVFPAGFFSNCTPHSFEPVCFYMYFCRLVLLVFNLIPDVDWSSVTVRHLYDVFLDQRAVKLPGILVSNLYEVFKNIHNSNLDHRLRDLNWRIVWGALKTAHHFFKWGIGNGKCPRANCGVRECISHVLGGLFLPFPTLCLGGVCGGEKKIKGKPFSL